MHLMLMENLPCDLWCGLSKQACDSEGARLGRLLMGGLGEGTLQGCCNHKVGLGLQGQAPWLSQ